MVDTTDTIGASLLAILLDVTFRWDNEITTEIRNYYGLYYLIIDSTF